jgi:hypothetical protein
MRLFTAILALAACGVAQPLTLGLKGGLRGASGLDGQALDESKKYLMGPMAEVRLPYGFAFEFDALYSRSGYTMTFSNTYNGFFLFYTQRARFNSWEFPLLLKYRLPVPHVKPYAVGGYAPRHTGGRSTYSGISPSSPSGPLFPFLTTAADTYASDHAWVAGGGVECKTGHLRVAPEIRYLRWNDARLDRYFGGPYDVRERQNEVQVLLGIGWGGK